MANKVNDCKLELFADKLNTDWTFAINQTLNIRRRACTTFIAKDRTKNSNEVRCGCNRLRREHSWNIFDSNETKWDADKHTRSAYNNAYGYLPNSSIHYLRCDIETDPNILARLLYDVWKIKSPKLIMCIIGGAKYFKLNERLEREFIKGIIQAALKADGWIVTSGFKTGVVQLIGEAIHDHRVTNPQSHITAIGCSKWGATRNREALILKKSSATQLNEIRKSEKGQQDLEPNHTHFLLLDDGTYNNYDLKDYRTRFVVEVSKYRHANVPIVTIVVEGGPDTLSAIYNDLRNDIPVVLIDGSGRIPNLLANFLTRTAVMINQNNNKNNSIELIDVEDHQKLSNMFVHYEKEIRHGLKDISKGSRTSDDDMNKLFYYFLYCLQPAIRKKFQIFSLESDHDLDDTIFEAIIQAKQQKHSNNQQGLNREQLLQLALAWDAIEVAKEHIIKDDLNDLNSESKTKLFFEALLLDRPQFIHTFIKLNFNLSEIFYEKQINKPWKLNWSRLEKLYNDHDKKKKEHLVFFMKNPIQSPNDLDHILRQLIGDYMKPIYTKIDRHSNKSWSFVRLNRIGNDQSDIIDPDEAKNEVRELVFRDLFLWSILTNRIEMSKIFLCHMDTRICASLIASKIFKSFLSFALDNESQDILRSQADQFEEYANECLKSCYDYDEDKACEIAIRQINIFGNVSALQVAVDADDKNFVGQPCCDQLLTNIWYDKIEPYQTTISNRIEILSSLCTFGLLAPILISFRKEDILLENQPINQLIINENQEKQIQLNKFKRLNNYGINYRSKTIDLIIFRQMKYFHQAPIIKYAYNSFGYILFLLFFSYYLLFELQYTNEKYQYVHWTEIYVILTITSMLIEEIRQFLCQDNRTMFGKMSSYFLTNQFFNIIRVISYLLFYLGLILRFTNTYSEEAFSSAKIILAYDLEIWFLRLLAFLGIAQNMGPKLVMIRKMIKDLFFFTFIILTAMTAYGVTSRTMYNYPNTTLTFDGRSIFRNILYPTYYMMYGNFGNELANLDENQNTSAAIATHILLAFHMLFVNILLINLLIAMFSFTFTSVQNQTDLVWRYERYSLIREYFDRPPFFPPFIILAHLYELGRFIVRHLSKDERTSRRKVFKMIGASREVDKDWAEFERYATNLYVRSIVNCSPTKLNCEQQQPTTSSFDGKAIMDEISSIRKAVVDLRTYSEEMNRCMEWMMDAMDRVKMSKEPKPRIQSNISTSDTQ